MAATGNISLGSIIGLISIFLLKINAQNANLNDATECRFTQTGSSYAGSVSSTVSGLECQRWDSQTPHTHALTDPGFFPDDTLAEAGNSCRNPGGMKEHGVWCFTTDDATPWEYCPVSRCECRRTKSGFDYAGKVAVTRGGVVCQRWDSMTPHGHDYIDATKYPDANISMAENFCRNPATWWEQGVWCFTIDPNIRWQHCDIDFCECKVEDEGLTYMGVKNTTRSGKACQAWASQSPHEHSYTDDSMYPDGTIGRASNMCRNPDDNEPGGPWCYTLDPDTRWGYCDVPKCEFSLEIHLVTAITTPSAAPFTGTTPGDEVVTERIGGSRQECKFTAFGSTYRGYVSQTVSNKICQRWDSQAPHAHQYINNDTYPDGSPEEASNFCRNPATRLSRPLGPWCYTNMNTPVWEYCDVPSCDCRVSRRGVEYVGPRNFTESDYTCQRWDRQSPHIHNYRSDRLYPDGDISSAANYCRNPRNSGPRPWCFTTDRSKRWEYCDIPMCECKQDVAGLEYMGFISQTIDSETCQRWDSQSPHPHTSIDDSMFPDGSVTSAANYCRNPDKARPDGPWCYTTDPATEWQYCDVPLCELLASLQPPSTTTPSPTPVPTRLSTVRSTVTRPTQLPTTLPSTTTVISTTPSPATQTTTASPISTKSTKATTPRNLDRGTSNSTAFRTALTNQMLTFNSTPTDSTTNATTNVILSHMEEATLTKTTNFPSSNVPGMDIYISNTTIVVQGQVEDEKNSNLTSNYLNPDWAQTTSPSMNLSSTLTGLNMETSVSQTSMSHITAAANATLPHKISITTQPPDTDAPHLSSFRILSYSTSGVKMTSTVLSPSTPSNLTIENVITQSTTPKRTTQSTTTERTTLTTTKRTTTSTTLSTTTTGSTSFSPNVPSVAKGVSSKSRSSVIAGAVVGVLLVLLAISAAIVIYLRYVAVRLDSPKKRLTNEDESAGSKSTAASYDNPVYGDNTQATYHAGQVHFKAAENGKESSA